MIERRSDERNRTGLPRGKGDGLGSYRAPLVAVAHRDGRLHGPVGVRRDPDVLVRHHPGLLGHGVAGIHEQLDDYRRLLVVGDGATFIRDTRSGVNGSSSSLAGTPRATLSLRIVTSPGAMIARSRRPMMLTPRSARSARASCVKLRCRRSARRCRPKTSFGSGMRARMESV